MEGKKVLVVGGGGRCHAIVDALARSPQVGRIYCAPGNAGIAAQAECVAIGDTDVESLKRFAESVLQREEKRLDSCASITANFAPQRLMRLGFGIARMHGKALRSTEGLHKGDVFELEMCDGTVSAEITGIGTGKES